MKISPNQTAEQLHDGVYELPDGRTFRVLDEAEMRQFLKSSNHRLGSSVDILQQKMAVYREKNKDQPEYSWRTEPEQPSLF